MLKYLLSSSFLQDVLALGLAQVINYIVPILLIPYLLSTIGADGWGRILFVQIFLQYFVVLVLYGFQWSGVRDIAKIVDDKDAVNKVFSSSWYVQWILLVFSFLLLILFIGFNKRIDNDLFLVGFLSIIGIVVFPSWLMQALKELKVMSLIQTLSQLFCVSMIFLFITGDNDVVLALLFQSINNLLSGIVCLYYLYRKGYHPIPCTFSEIIYTFRSGFVFFKSQLMIVIYTNTIPFVLGYVGSNTDVSAYIIADKIQKGIRFLLEPISRAMFPRISNLVSKDFKKAKELFFKIAKYSFIMLFPCCLGIYLLSPWLVILLGGGNIPEASIILKVFSIMPILISFSSLLSIQWLLPLGKEKDLQKIWKWAAILTIIIVYPICDRYGSIGASFLVIAIEIFIIICMIMISYRRKLFS